MFVRTTPCSARFVALALLTAFAYACSDGAAGSSCTVKKDEGRQRATITCDDGSSAVIDGGDSASGCSVKENADGTKTITCKDGTKVDIADGKDGADGDDGAKGTKGAEGTDGLDGANGAKGARGADGPDGMDGKQGLDGADGRATIVVGAGLKLTITDVSVPDDLHPVVALSILDAKDRPLDRTGLYSPGAVNIGFVIAYLSSTDGVVGEYVPYNLVDVAGKTLGSVEPAMSSAKQAKSENNGTWTELDPTKGTYTYRFNLALPSDYDKTKTHTVSAYASRSVEGVSYASDPIFHFRPDGEDVTERREIVATETCNKCHDTLAVHGGSRRDTGLCITCHVEGTFDPESGNSLDFKQMIHKIHRGKNLPSVKALTPYEIVGYNDTPHDYSDVAFPQAMENCTTCHQGAPDSNRWQTSITRAACTSCHDRTSFEDTPVLPFKAHKAGARDSDESCLGCHAAGKPHIGQYEVDVTKVHVPVTQLPLRDANGDLVSEAPVLTGEIIQVVNVGAGENPKITFTVAVNGEPYDILDPLKKMSSLRFTFAAPTTDYVGYSQYTAQGSGAVGTIVSTGTDGEFTWTSTTKTMQQIADASGAAAGSNAFPLTGTLAVGMEGRITGPATKADGTQLSSATMPSTAVNYAMHNKIKYVALTDSTAVPRREATTVENCDTCHEDLSAHGGSRNDPEYCVMCHSAGRDTITRMPLPAAGKTAKTENLRLSYMVHAIHSGKNRENDFIAYSPSAAIDFSDVRFPGDRRRCEHCHVKDQYQIPLPDGLLASRWRDIDSTRAVVKSYYTGPTTGACIGCHDAQATELHAATMSLISPSDPTDIKESCANCHASGKEFGLDTVHARTGL